MCEKKKEIVYQKILSLVRQDQSSDVILHKLTINAIKDAEAREMIQNARKARIRTIRGTSYKHLFFGLLWFALTWLTSFIIYPIGLLRTETTLILYSCGLYGAFTFARGLVGAIFADRKRGPLPD